MPIYLDNAATTPLCGSAKAAMTAAMEIYANPSSTHTMGLEARSLLLENRKKVALALKCDVPEVIFESCGSEANNHAFKAALALRAHAPKRIITTDSEHPAVDLALTEYEQNGYEVVRLKTLGGVIDMQELEGELAKGCAFVSIMHANNETGAVYDIPGVKRAIDKSGCGALLHCDDVQGFMKLPSITKYCDFVSVSAHKIGGPKGIGALYAKGRRIIPLVWGGGQENSRRSGTENTIGIAGFAAACDEWAKDTERNKRIAALRDYTADALKRQLGSAVSVLEPANRIGGMLSLSLDVAMGGRKAGSEVLHNWLSSHGICVSFGSACHASKKDNRVLDAYGLDRAKAESTLRISFGFCNTQSDADELIKAVVLMSGGNI